MIWCVDDDEAIRDIEVYTLQTMGFEARGFSDGKMMCAALEKEKPQLIILDIMMPGEDGITLLKRIKCHPKYEDIPVIMATAKGTEMDKIQGLNLGADDYLTKPFGIMEMVARVKAVLRRIEKQGARNSYKVGNIELKEEAHQTFAYGKEVELTQKEFTMLTLFVKNPNIVFSRERLMNEVWGLDYVGESRTVDMHIKTLRKKLGDAGAQIRTVIGVGYRLEEQI